MVPDSFSHLVWALIALNSRVLQKLGNVMARVRSVGYCAHSQIIWSASLMSALGQKQTYAAHKPMSALPPTATAKADMTVCGCLLYPQKRTCAVQTGMSALGQ